MSGRRPPRCPGGGTPSLVTLDSESSSAISPYLYQAPPQLSEQYPSQTIETLIVSVSLFQFRHYRTVAHCCLDVIYRPSIESGRIEEFEIQFASTSPNASLSLPLWRRDLSLDVDLPLSAIFDYHRRLLSSWWRKASFAFCVARSWRITICRCP